MAIHKLTTDPSTFVSGTVTNVEEDASGNYGPEYKITMQDGTQFYLKPDPTHRQLQRLQLGYVTDLIGRAVKFSKTPMRNDPNKSFLNIDLIGATAKPALRVASGGKQPHSLGPRIPGLDPDDTLGLELVEQEEAATVRQFVGNNAPATRAIPASAPVPRPQPVAQKTREEKNAIAQSWYAVNIAYVLDNLVPLILEKQIPVEGRDVAAMASTITIEGSK